MSKYDLYIGNCIRSEHVTRINFYLKNSDLINKHAKADGKFKERLDTVKQEIKEVTYIVFILIKQF